MFFFNDTATTEIYTLSLHDALPIFPRLALMSELYGTAYRDEARAAGISTAKLLGQVMFLVAVDRKSTRLNSSHANISYAVFCLKKKNNYRLLINQNHILFLSISSYH